MKSNPVPEMQASPPMSAPEPPDPVWPHVIPRPEVRIVAVYLVVASLWVIVCDYIAYGAMPERPISVQTMKAGDTTPGIEAQIVLAHVYARQRLVDEAVAAYAAVVARYPTHPKAAEAMYYQAQAILGTRRGDRDSEAHKLLSEIADRFSGHAFVPPALLARAEIEARRKNYRFDAVLGKAVPASLVTYRELSEIRTGGREREHALWRLGQAYERVERFDLAAQAYRELGEDYAHTHYDAWASAARIYDHRLKDPVLARAAYQRVPASSPAYKDAQKFIRPAS